MTVKNAQNKLQRLVNGLFTSLAHFAIRYPLRMLGVAGLVTLAAAPGILRLRLRTDGHALVPPRAPEVLYDKEIRDQFGIEDQIVVLIRCDQADGIFNRETVELVRELTTELERMPGINPSNVMSLATEPSFRMRPGTLIHQTLLEPRLTTAAELEQLREDLRKIELYNGTFISADKRSTVILIGVPSSGDRTGIYRRVLDIITAKKPAGQEVTVTGAPVAESLLGIHILEDLGVPKSFLGGSTRTRIEKPSGKAPASFDELRLLLARRIGLVPLAALVMMLILFLSFRNLLAVLVPLPGLLATLLFVFGFMGWSGVPIYLTIAVMPVLLTATGVTNDIYVFSRYFSLLREKPADSHVELLRETFEKMASPVAITSLTTSVGFFSFAFSPLGPVRAFGYCSGIGVLFGLICSFTLLPALLRLVKPAWLVSQRSEARTQKSERLPAWFARLGQWVVRRRWWMASAALLLTALTPLGLRHLVVQDSWTSGFAPDSEFSKATRLVNEQFYGMHLLFVSLDMPQVLKGELPASAVTGDGIVIPGNLVEKPAVIAGSAITISAVRDDIGGTSQRPTNEIWHSHIEMVYGLGTNIGTRIPRRDMPPEVWKSFAQSSRVRFEVAIHSHVRPAAIRAIGELAEFIRQRPQYAVGGVLSPADYLSTTRFMARLSDPKARNLPDDPAEIKLMWDYYGIARGQQRLHQIVDTNYWRSLTTVFLKDANFRGTARLMADIRQYEREKLAPKGIKIGFAGNVAVSQSLIQGIVATQLQSLFWSLLGIYVITSMLGGSWRWGLYCLLPSALAVLIKLAVMGWLGIPLGVATSMFAAMTLGIGVNCAIQLMESYGLARREGASLSQALGRAMVLTGPPALVNTIAVSLGFAVLMLSQVPANARLGLLLVVGLVNCFIASLLLLPILLHWWPLDRGVKG